MEDNEVLEVQDEIKEVEAVEAAPAPKKQNKKELVKEDKDVKTVYDVVLVFNDYKNKLDKYFEIDGKIVYDRFSGELTAKTVADKLMARGILVEINPITILKKVYIWKL